MWIINYTKTKLNKSHMSNFKCQKRYKNMRKEKHKLSFLSPFFPFPLFFFRLAFSFLLCSLGSLSSRETKFSFLPIFFFLPTPLSSSLRPFIAKFGIYVCACSMGGVKHGWSWVAVDRSSDKSIAVATWQVWCGAGPCRRL